MRRARLFASIFPMEDIESARLMLHKAECLFLAGVITSAEKRAVLKRADEILLAARATPQGRRADKMALLPFSTARESEERIE